MTDDTTKHNDRYHVVRNVDVTLEYKKEYNTYYVIVNGVSVVETWNAVSAHRVYEELWEVFSHQDLNQEDEHYDS
jgi:hypothetical protein